RANTRSRASGRRLPLSSSGCWRRWRHISSVALLDLLRPPTCAALIHVRLPCCFPRPDHQSCRVRNRRRETLLENRFHLCEERVEVIVVVFVFSGDGFFISRQHAVDVLVAVEERVEGEVARV